MWMMRNNRMHPDGRREKLCLVLSLFPFLFCQGHIRNRCSDLPLVILRRNATTGSFFLYQRLDDPAAIQQAREVLPVRRHLQSGDYAFEESISEKNHYPTDDPLFSLRGTVGNHDQYSTSSSIPALVIDHQAQADNRALHGYHQQKYNDTSDAAAVTSLINASSSLDGDDLFLAKECTCLEYDLYPERVYCPMAVSSCHELIDNHFDQPDDYKRKELGCDTPPPLREESMNSVAFYFLVPSLAFFVLILQTHFGRSAVSYVACRCCAKRWNERQADRLLQFQRDDAMRMIRTNIRVRYEQLQQQNERGVLHAQRPQTAARPNNPDDADTLALATMDLHERVTVNNVNRTSHVQENGRRPTSLALKTRILLSSSHKHLEEEDDEKTETCIICLSDLVGGDRVGALPCSHAFHVACLKPWLQRCNACPICKHEDVASSQFDESTDDLPPSTSQTDVETDSSSTPLSRSPEVDEDVRRETL